MTRRLTEAGRKFMALFMGATLCVLTIAQPSGAKAQSQPQHVDTIKARVRELHGKAAEVEIALADGAKLRGHIVRIEVDSFTIRQKDTAQEMALQYTHVTEVKKRGLSRGAKAALIPVIIGGGALLLLCAAPYPIGFLCREDPC